MRKDLRDLGRVQLGVGGENGVESMGFSFALHPGIKIFLRGSGVALCDRWRGVCECVCECGGWQIGAA